MRSTLRIEELELGALPRVVGTISSRECLESFEALFRDRCDIAEVRLDEVGEFATWATMCKNIQSCGVPVMLTLRTKQEGGKCQKNDLERLDVLREAAGSISIFDIEYRTGLAAKAKDIASSLGIKLLVSFHDFNKTPSIQELKNIITQSEGHADIIKISTMINSDEDIATLQAVLTKGSKVPLCIIGMGSKGTSTRVTFPSLGSVLTYGYLDYPSAPGQLSARTLVDHFRRYNSSYNEDIIIRKEILEFA